MLDKLHYVQNSINKDLAEKIYLESKEANETALFTSHAILSLVTTHTQTNQPFTVFVSINVGIYYHYRLYNEIPPGAINIIKYFMNRPDPSIFPQVNGAVSDDEKSSQLLLRLHIVAMYVDALSQGKKADLEWLLGIIDDSIDQDFPSIPKKPNDVVAKGAQSAFIETLEATLSRQTDNKVSVPVILRCASIFTKIVKTCVKYCRDNRLDPVQINEHFSIMFGEMFGDVVLSVYNAFDKNTSVITNPTSSNNPNNSSSNLPNPKKQLGDFINAIQEYDTRVSLIEGKILSDLRTLFGLF